MVGLDRQHIYLRYHSARDPKDEGRFLTYYRDNTAVWLDDLRPVRQPQRQDHAYAVKDRHLFDLDQS